MKSKNPTNYAKLYRQKFAGPKKKSAAGGEGMGGRGGGRERGGSLESLPGDEEEDGFSESDIQNKLDSSKEALYKIIENYLGNDPKLKAIADKIVKEGADPLRAVANNDNTFLNAHPGRTQLLEVIVKTDGSRPSFLIRNGEVDFDSSPVGDWKPQMIAIDTRLKHAIECVGRINLDTKHVGTGFLVHPNLVVTNRHVLQPIARQENNGEWTMHPSANIDFGYEYKGIPTLNLRKLKKLIYCGPTFIDRLNVDHKKLDLALIELEPVPDEMIPGTILQWNNTPDWAWDDTLIYTIGYPGDPGKQGTKNYTETLLELLFKKTYGCKRIAPGMVMDSGKHAPWTVTHDATTLGGNSGSVLLAKTKEIAASGLHYGGDLNEPRENWGHILADVLSLKSNDNKTLLEYLEKNNVELLKQSNA